MKEYHVSNRLKLILSIVGFLLLFALLGMWAQKKIFHSVADLEGHIYPKELAVGDTLFYVDKTSFSNTKQWNFGDGNISKVDSGYYFYKKPGYYQVELTVNDKYSKTYPIYVTEEVVQTSDFMTSVVAPEQAMQFENIVFRATSSNAEMYSWKFGESGIVDSKEPMAIYSYERPGEYMVSLSTDKTKYPIMHKIEILPSFEEKKKASSLEDTYDKIDDDFKYHLQRIADGYDYNRHFNYLRNRYLCGNDKIEVKVNSSKSNTFYNYSMGLTFDEDIFIQEAKVSFDRNMNCVTKVEITQNK